MEIELSKAYSSPKQGAIVRILTLLALIFLYPGSASATESEEESPAEPIKSVLVIGDSMSGWLGERLNAYGVENGFDVGTIVWDGATIQKYADNPNLKHIIETRNPQAVIFCLGLNNLGEPSPERLRPAIDKLREAVGDRELIWVGPPTWPGKPKWTALNNWLQQEIGEDRYFNTFPLTLPRQSASNPHPTREGVATWGDKLMQWLDSSDLNFPGSTKPSGAKFSKGKYYVYKKMKERL